MHILVITLLALTAAPVATQAERPLADPAPQTLPEVTVRAKKTVEQLITARGWFIKKEGDDLGLLPNDKIVCRRLSKVGTRLPPAVYTCGSVGDWRQITELARQQTECLQPGGRHC